MIKDGGLTFETQLKIEFLPLYNGSKKCLGKSLLSFADETSTTFITEIMY